MAGWRLETRSSTHQLGVVQPHADQRVHLLPRELLQRAVVVALVRTAGDPHQRAFHAFEGIPHRVDVGSLRIVDPQHALLLGHRFEPVFDGREVVERLADLRRSHAGGQRRERRSHGIVGVVKSGDAHLRHVDLDRLLACCSRKLAVAQKGVARTARYSIARRERQLPHPQVVLGQLLPDRLVVARIDEPVARSLILRDAHLRVDVVPEAMIVAVEVVGRDIHQHPDVGTETVHAVELERTQLQHIPVVVARGHRVGEALADIAAQSHVQPGVAHDLVDERRGGRLAVRSGDADAPRLAHVAPCEFDLGDDRNARRADFPHDGRRLGYAR